MSEPSTVNNDLETSEASATTPEPSVVGPAPKKPGSVNPMVAVVIILLVLGAISYFYVSATQTPRHQFKTVKHG